MKLSVYAGVYAFLYQQEEEERLILVNSTEENFAAVYFHDYIENKIFKTRVYIWDKTFSDYLHKKLAEGKHYYVALSHAIKKLVRVIYALQTTGQTYFSAVA